MTLGISIIVLIVTRLLLWKRFNNPGQYGGFLQTAIHYRDTGRLEATYDFYPSWRKHPLSVTEYQGFFRLFGLFLRTTRLPAHRGAQMLQLLLSALLGWTLSQTMPEALGWLPYLALTASIAPLFLSVVVTPDILLMAAIGCAMSLLHHLEALPPGVASITLGFLGWAGVRIKSSGFILSITIILSTPFIFAAWPYVLLPSALTLAPLAVDLVTKSDNMILHLARTQISLFGYSLDHAQACVPPSEFKSRSFRERIGSFLHLLKIGWTTALNPFSSFGLIKSCGSFYPLGLLGMISALVQGSPGTTKTLLLFSCLYVAVALSFLSLLMRHYLFGGRAGGTLLPIWIVWTAHFVNSLGAGAQWIIWAFLGLEALYCLRTLYGRSGKILFEPIYPRTNERNAVIAFMRRILKPKDLLFLTYRDLGCFSFSLGAWQAVIELEKATVPIVCKYIDYYTHDRRYHKIYLVLPPRAHIFFDKNRRFHYVEETEFAARFRRIHESEDLDGYGIYEALRPVQYRDLRRYERLSPDQLKNGHIDFGALKPVCSYES